MNEQTRPTRCPGCGRHCDLSMPGCERGETFAKTGAMPQRGMEGRGGHGGHGEHGHPGRDLTQDPRYAQESLPGKLSLLLRELGRPRHGGRDAQDRVLAILRRDGEMTQRDLTERLGIQPGSASELIGKLESGGYVSRAQSEQDRRTQNVRLTQEGFHRSLEQEGMQRTRRDERFQVLSQEEQQTLLELLEKLYRERRPQKEE